MEDIKDIESSKIEEYLSKLGDWALNKGFQLVLAIICMYIGMKLSKLIVKMIRKSFKKSNMEESVASFLLSLIKFTFYAIVFITAASIVGFQVTSLVTILGTASLAIGLALQGSLANFAGLANLEKDAAVRAENDTEKAFCVAYRALEGLLGK